MSNLFNKKTVIFFSIFLVVFSLFNLNTVHASLQESGSANSYSAGNIQALPSGFALTAIGYGSDDHKCVLAIKTAPINSDGTVDFANASWQGATNCASGSAGNERSLEAGSDEVISGWSWGANTSGGSPNDDSSPQDECFYQEYMDLQTKNIFSWGSSNTGTCEGLGYQQNWLKAVVHAPSNHVIVGIKMALDNDSVLDFLAIETNTVSSAPTDVCPNDPGVQTSLPCSPPAPASGLYCDPVRQTVSVGQTVSFSAGNGDGNYTWFATDAVPDTGSGSNFSTKYLVPDTGKTVRVTSGGVTVNCYVVITGPGGTTQPPAVDVPVLEICPAGTQPPITGCANKYIVAPGSSIELHAWYNQYGWNSSSAGQAAWMDVTDTASWLVCNGNAPCLGDDFNYTNKKGTFHGENSGTAPVNANYDGTGDQVALVISSSPVPASCNAYGRGICGYVYNDANQNKIKDAGEVGIPNVHVVVNSSGGATEEAYTDASGFYNIARTKVWSPDDQAYVPYDFNQGSSYTVSSQTPSGYTPTTPTSIDFVFDNPFMNFDFGMFAGGPVNPQNNRPVITLLGSNPVNINVGQTYVDPGATAQDVEDGNITAKIATTSNVNINTAGTYTVTYNVSDSQGLSAVPVSRTVNVLNPTGGGGGTGKITFCLVLADQNNVIATSSGSLPAGIFSIDLASTTGFGTTTLQSKSWLTSSFSPNRKLIVNSGLDADCVTFSNLSLGTYYYSQLGVVGALWFVPQYNDQDTQAVNNVFDFFPYSPELFTATTTDDAGRNLNSDGQIILTAGNQDRTLVIFEKDNTALSCPAPQITSALTASGVVGQAFSYLFTATSSTPSIFSVGALPAGLAFSTSTNTISGTPTVSGTFNIPLNVINQCVGGIDSKTLVLTVSNPSGGGGGSGSIADVAVSKTSNRTSASVGDTVIYTITVTNNGPQTATLVNVTDVIPSTLDLVSVSTTFGSYSTTTNVWSIGNLDNASSTTLTITTTVKSGSQGQKITNTATVAATQSDPTSPNNTSSVDVSINPAPSSGGGGGG
ncbi:MAG: immunoglobulin-like domain-containing protein, partial [Nitrospira sp.]